MAQGDQLTIALGEGRYRGSEAKTEPSPVAESLGNGEASGDIPTETGFRQKPGGRHQ